MKTSNLIIALRCNTSKADKCKICPARAECNALFDPFSRDGEEVIAERLEQLLANLRNTQEQLKIIKNDRDTWRKRYTNLQRGLKDIVHENELLDNLMN